jgi:hypothetical protein
MKPSTLHQALIATGFLAFLISLFAAMQFYASLGETFGGKIVYVATGILLLSVAVILLPVCMKLYYEGQILATLFFALIWAMLTVLSVFSEFGFFAKQQSQAESARAAQSQQARLAGEEYQQAGKRLEDFGRYATLDAAALESQHQAAASEVESLQSQLAACPKNHITKCINPAMEKLNQARQSLAAVESQITGAQTYAGALAAKQQALQAVSSAKAPAKSDLHPAYQWSETLTGIPAATIQVFSTAIIVVILELWASLAAYLLMKLYGVAHLGESPQRKPAYGYPPIPAPPPAARLLDRLQGYPLSDKPLLDKADSTHLSDKPLLDKADSTHLSDRRKGVQAPCIECGTTITLKHKNHLRCDSCRVEHERTYRIKGMRHAAG